MKKSLLYFLTVCFFCSADLRAQEKGEEISKTLQSIYQNYDSVQYLSFDVRFDYGSDTLLGKYDAEQMGGTYTLAGKRAKYRLGDIDFMQNDSFFIAVYNKDKIILVDEPKAINMGAQLPMRQQMDSLLLVYASQYSIRSFNSSADTGVIELVRIDSLAQFDKFTITYDNRNKVLYQLYYEYTEVAELDSTVSVYLMEARGDAGVPTQKKRFTITFSNYRFDNYEDSDYDEGQYIWFENGVCKPSAKYEEFKIYYSKPAVQYTELPDDK